MRAWGIALLIGSALTLVWFLVCPTYAGPDTVEVSVPYRSSETRTEYRPRLHRAMDYFIPIDIVIWSAVAGCCLLRADLRRAVTTSLGPIPPESPTSLRELRTTLRTDFPSA